MFACFLAAIAKVFNFSKEDWVLGYATTQAWGFLYIF